LKELEKYRPDIDGLRAIAILLVILYHFFPSLVPSGFIGVDIFFVISGYLISKNIFNNLKKNKFSFLDFYRRRIRRIFPSLIIVLIFSLVFSYALMLPNEFELFVEHLFYSATFLYNFILINGFGYFEAETLTKPLLHLWSLSIEEQFYLIWPVILFFLWKRKNTNYFLFLFFFLSLFLFIFLSKNINNSFYLPYCRFFELIAGSLIAYYEIFKTKTNINRFKTTGIIGFLIILISVYVIDNNNFFFGLVLLPVAGSSLIIFSNKNNFINKNILSNKLLVFIGLISYPLYLWHWPILSFAIIYEGLWPDRYYRFFLLFIIFSLAIITHIFFEKPLRFNKKIKNLELLLILSILLIIIFSIFLKKNINNKYSSDQISSIQKVFSLEKNSKNLIYNNNKDSCFAASEKEGLSKLIKNNCFKIKDDEKKTIFLIGDSHSAALSLGLKKVLEENNYNFLYISTGYCNPTNNNTKNTECIKTNKYVLNQISFLKPEILIIDSNYLIASNKDYFLGENFLTYFQNYIANLKSLGAKRIYIVGQLPTYKISLTKLVIKNFIIKDIRVPQYTETDLLVKESIKMDKDMRNIKYPKDVFYLSLTDLICKKDGSCLILVGNDLETDIIYWTYGHLTFNGSLFIANNIRNILIN
jgi:peptidoglycan/LPS O-acetylase OafA/YrhL